jgi:hypothetical protein
MDRTGSYKDQIILKRLDASVIAPGPDQWVEFEVDPIVYANVQSEGGEGYRVAVRYRADLIGFKDTHPAISLVWRRGNGVEDRELDVTDIIETDRGREITLVASSRQVETLNLGQGARRTQAWR